MDWKQKTQNLIAEANSRHKEKLQIKPKTESKFLWKFLNLMFQIITFGQGVSLINSFSTTVGRTIWLAGDGSSFYNSEPYWQYALISHELDHMDYMYFQDSDARDKYPDTLREVSWFGKLSYYFKYLFWIIPYKYAIGRQEIEIKGYERTLEAEIVQHGSIRHLKTWLVSLFSGPSYFWMATPERANEIVDALLDKVEFKYNAGKLDHLK